jgi:hypothetical protein
MSKLTGPLMSLGASKSMKKTLTFQGRPSGTAAYRYKIPYDTKRPTQLNIRSYMRNAVSYWRGLSAYQRSLWNLWVK